MTQRSFLGIALIAATLLVAAILIVARRGGFTSDADDLLRVPEAPRAAPPEKARDAVPAPLGTAVKVVADDGDVRSFRFAVEVNGRVPFASMTDGGIGVLPPAAGRARVWIATVAGLIGSTEFAAGDHEVTVRLPNAASIRGSVTADGLPYPGVTLAVEMQSRPSADAPAAVLAALFPEEGHVSPEGTVRFTQKVLDPDGAYLLAGLPSGASVTLRIIDSDVSPAKGSESTVTAIVPAVVNFAVLAAPGAFGTVVAAETDEGIGGAEVYYDGETPGGRVAGKTTAGADGSFAFHVPEGTSDLRLRASAAGRTDQTRSFDFRDRAEVNLGHIPLARARMAAVHVTDRENRPIEGARLFDSEDGRSPLALTGEDGAVLVAVGPDGRTLIVRAAGRRSERITLSADCTELRCVLAEASTIEFLAPFAADDSRLEVTVSRADGPVLVRADGEEDLSSLIGTDGRWKASADQKSVRTLLHDDRLFLARVPAGILLTVALEDPAVGIVVTQELTLAEGERRMVDWSAASRKTARIAGRVVDEKGNGIPKALVLFGRAHEPVDRAAIAVVTAGGEDPKIPAGTFSFLGALRGAASMVVVARGRSIVVEPEVSLDGNPRTITLGPSAGVAVFVKNAARSGEPGVAVRMVTEVWESAEQITDSAGRAVFSEDIAGPFELSARRGTKELARVRMDGRKSAIIELPEAGTIVLAWKKPEARCRTIRARLTAVGDPSREPIRSETGEVAGPLVVHDLSPGRFEVSLEKVMDDGTVHAFGRSVTVDLLAGATAEVSLDD